MKHFLNLKYHHFYFFYLSYVIIFISVALLKYFVIFQHLYYEVSIFASLSLYQLRAISAGTCSDFYCLFQTFQIEILRLKHQLFGA